MDLEMPSMDGSACVREIRAMENRNQVFKRVPVIAVTVNVRDSHVVAAKEAGMDDIVTKSISVGTLLKRMAPWIPLA